MFGEEREQRPSVSIDEIRARNELTYELNRHNWRFPNLDRREIW